MANSEDPGTTLFSKFKNNVQGQKLNIILKILPVTPQSTQWTVPFLLYQNVWENPSEYKGLNINGCPAGLEVFSPDLHLIPFLQEMKALSCFLMHLLF